ncbi:hypothetical protein DDK21_12760 [Achromobacter xylosoxidans]|nr:hypothetical protein DDK21_12760 [Achromobacter xylosoxidans]
MRQRRYRDRKSSFANGLPDFIARLAPQSDQSCRVPLPEYSSEALGVLTYRRIGQQLKIFDEEVEDVVVD